MKKGIFLLLVSVVVLVGCNSTDTAEYRLDLQNVADEILENAAKAEEILDQYATVWDYSIKSRGSIPVAEMAQVTGFEQDVIEEHFVINVAGNIPDDFSTNIHSLNAYYEGTGQLDEIQNASDDIKNKMTELNDPPEAYKEVYDEVLDMYTHSEEYIRMALNPSGSLQSFNDDISRLTTEILNKYNRIEAIMPSED